ncbi:REJ domain-containing protein [Ochromonadaceae sp. CCMP2298]|nr:REJ domain-containing protein [Ochromonadaceae sp. CCMP2298]
MYTISVTVSNAASVDTTSMQLTIVAGAVPGISMGPAHSKYNVGDKVILSAALATPAGPADVTWGSSVASLSDLALTKLTKRITGAAGFAQLALDSASLTPGASYVFTLSAAYASSTTATSQLTLRMNSPPQNGVVASSPNTGAAMSTDYFLSTSRWTDDADDYPLWYTISYYSLPSDVNIVKYIDTVGHVTTWLGQGLRSLNYLQTILVTASDSLGGAASATTTATVTPAAADLVVQNTMASLDAALSDANPSALTQAVSAALLSVNSVDCTVPQACGSVNRELCSATPNTCGPCLGGYLGPTGDSNVACSDAAVMQGVGAKCTSNAVCITVGRFGSACSQTAFQFAQLRLLRESMCYGVYKTLSLQDVTADVVQSRALVVGNILQDISQISDPALGNCTQALVETVVQYPSLSCIGTSSQLVTAALSNVLQKGLSLPPDLLESVTLALLSLSEGCQSQSAAGQTPITLITANMKILSAVGDKVSLLGSFTSPTTDFEKFNQAPASSLSLNSSSLSDTDSVGLSLIQLSVSDIGATIVLQNHIPITYVTVPTLYGVYNVSCPGRVDLPVCTTYDGEVFAPDSSCSVVAYTPHNTTCYCVGSQGGSQASRRLQGEGESREVQYSTAMRVVKGEFSSTYLPSPPLTLVQNNSIITGTLLGVLALLLVGLSREVVCGTLA